jgi:signal transduction histidine kinase
LETISVAAQRIARIVQEFIKLSQVEGGLYETVDLGTVVRHAVGKFTDRDDAQDIAVLETVPPEPLLVKASAQLIDQVLHNILTNSLEAMPHGGRIDVQAGFSEGHHVYCSIRDSGYGIPPAELKRVFEPGYTTKVEAGVVRGIGLGLYTAERIIKSHGGTIWLESEEGKYTIVTFTLSRVPAEPDPRGDTVSFTEAGMSPRTDSDREPPAQSSAPLSTRTSGSFSPGGAPLTAEGTDG